MDFKNKKLFLIGLAVIMGLIFSATASSASVAECGESRSPFSGLSSFLSPFFSFAEKLAGNFGYEVVLAAAPDPDFCGSDSVICVGASPRATISWGRAPNPLYTWQCPYWWNLSYYILRVQRIGDINTGLSTSRVVSGLLNDTTYNWSVEAYYCPWACRSSADCGIGGQPRGSFRTPNCVPPPTVTLTANGVRPQIKIAEGWSVNLNWTSANADSCTASGAWSGNVPVQDQTPAYTFIPSFGIYTYTIQCTGPGGQSNPSSVVVDVVRPILTLARGSQTCLAVNLSWSWNDPFFNGEYAQYRVLRSDDGLVFSERAVVSAPAMTYQDQDVLISDQTYYYQIEALKPGFSSVVSNVIQTVPCPRLPGWEEIRPR